MDMQLDGEEVEAGNNPDSNQIFFDDEGLLNDLFQIAAGREDSNNELAVGLNNSLFANSQSHLKQQLFGFAPQAVSDISSDDGTASFRNGGNQQMTGASSSGNSGSAGRKGEEIQVTVENTYNSVPTSLVSTNLANNVATLFQQQQQQQQQQPAPEAIAQQASQLQEMLRQIYASTLGNNGASNSSSTNTNTSSAQNCSAFVQPQQVQTQQQQAQSQQIQAQPQQVQAQPQIPQPLLQPQQMQASQVNNSTMNLFFTMDPKTNTITLSVGQQPGSSSTQQLAQPQQNNQQNFQTQLAHQGQQYAQNTGNSPLEQLLLQQQWINLLQQQSQQQQQQQPAQQQQQQGVAAPSAQQQNQQPMMQTQQPPGMDNSNNFSSLFSTLGNSAYFHGNNSNNISNNSVAPGSIGNNIATGLLNQGTMTGNANTSTINTSTGFASSITNTSAENFQFQQSNFTKSLQQLAAELRNPPSVSPEVLKAAQLPPLKALSAYNFFFRDERDRILHGGESDYSSAREQKLLKEHWNQDRTKKRRHRKTHGKISFTTLSKLISQRWKELPDESKSFYRGIAVKDWERYQRELDAHKAAVSASTASYAFNGLTGNNGISISSSTTTGGPSSNMLFPSAVFPSAVIG